MAKLIQKSGYINSGNASGYMKYIATRENVEKLLGNGPATKNQQRLIEELLRNFPDAKELFEYEDYIVSPTLGNASAFITMALDTNAHSIQDTDGYMKYIATRPRVERQGEHGLFGDSDSVSLPASIKELNSHDGRVWTFIYSLRREDAARLGYDSAAKWRQLLLSHRQKLAKIMQIPSGSFRWYAAFHNEGSHPHIHMMVWSDDPKRGYLNPNGIAAMRSALTNEIFKDELYALYKEKDISYKEITERAQSAMRELITQMESSVCDNPVITQMMVELAQELESVTGKKVYGYLKKPLKEKVDTIVDELSKLQSVTDCYAVWNELRDKLESYYKTTPRAHLPLSQQKEFKAIKNMIIREAENIRLGVYTFEDEAMQNEPQEDISGESSGNPKERYEKAAVRGDQYAQYRLGRLYLLGEDVPKDVKKAIEYLTASAEQGNQYAQYALGKLYLIGRDTQRDEEAAHKWLTASAAQGNQYAQFFLERIGQFRDPSVLLAATRLLHHLANTFRDNSQPPANPAGLRIGSKRRRKLMQKRLAIGHKPDDHADPELKQ